MVEFGASDAAGQVHRPQSAAEDAVFSYAVYRFNSDALAKEGYRRALRTYRRPGFTSRPDREHSYTSASADKYATFCGDPVTTPGNCWSVGRYTNYVVVVGLVPGAGVGVEHLPELFGAVDCHIQAVIDSAREP